MLTKKEKQAILKACERWETRNWIFEKDPNTDFLHDKLNEFYGSYGPSEIDAENIIGLLLFLAVEEAGGL